MLSGVGVPISTDLTTASRSGTLGSSVVRRLVAPGLRFLEVSAEDGDGGPPPPAVAVSGLSENARGAGNLGIEANVVGVDTCDLPSGLTVEIVGRDFVATDAAMFVRLRPRPPRREERALAQIQRPKDLLDVLLERLDASEAINAYTREVVHLGTEVWVPATVIELLEKGLESLRRVAHQEKSTSRSWRWVVFKTHGYLVVCRQQPRPWFPEGGKGEIPVACQRIDFRVQHLSA